LPHRSFISFSRRKGQANRDMDYELFSDFSGSFIFSLKEPLRGVDHRFLPGYTVYKAIVLLRHKLSRGQFFGGAPVSTGAVRGAGCRWRAHLLIGQKFNCQQRQLRLRLSCVIAWNRSAALRDGFRVAIRAGWAAVSGDGSVRLRE